MKQEEFISLIKGQKIRRIFLANMYPDGDPCKDEILIDEMELENGIKILFDGLARAEIKKGACPNCDSAQDTERVIEIGGEGHHFCHKCGYVFPIIKED